MDLEVVGRHALLFDDDANAAFVNSGDALVEWHSLQIDRYDVRHLLPAPPPSRRRSRNSETIHSDDPSLQSQLDYERYLDLILQPDQPDIEEEEKPLDTGGYRAVAFSYGNTDDFADQNYAALGVESSGFHPPFPIPGDLVQSLPQTEKMHQIIARTAIFVSKHGGQSEIVLRVKQGDNPTFGFLMPDHQLHAYFRYLVEHPHLLNSEFDGRSQNDEQKDGGEHKGIGGALSLLGSVYGSGEEEDDDDMAKTEKGVKDDNTSVVNNTVSHGSTEMESKADSNKDESISRNSILSNKENTIAVKKNSLVTTSKSGNVKGIKKDDKSVKVKNSAMEATSKVEPLILEPSPELKRIIDKLVEFILRNGKQFEATLIEQDSKHGRFPFLLPSNQYHAYYLKVLQSAQQSKANGRSSSYSGKANKSLSSLPSAASYLPLEIDRKEKFKMAIGKSKEAESKGHEPVDAETAAAILQAATRGIKTSNIQMISSTTSNGHANNSQGNHVSSLPKSQLDNSAGRSEEQLTEEQKLKAERLRRAKMFVAMLKSGTVPPHKQGTSSGSSVEPLHSDAADVNLNSRERECSLAPDTFDGPATAEKPEERNYFDEHSEPLSKRTYRPRSVKCEEDSDEDQKEHNDRLSRRKHRSRRCRRYEEDDEHEDSIETEEKHHKKRHLSRSRSSSEENRYEDKNHKRSRKKHHSSHESSRKRRSSKQHSDSEEDEHDNKETDHKDSSKKHHHSNRSSSHHSKDKRNRHMGERSLREEKSRHKRKHHNSSSDDEYHHSRNNLDKDKRGWHGDGNKLEDGEISSKAAPGQSRETSMDVASSHQGASSQPAENLAEVPNDLRAKVRAMLMATRLS